MMVCSEDILSRLPPFRDEWVLVKEEQYVPDIMRDIIAKHRQFRGYYDEFSYLFYDKNVSVIADNLYDFCKREIDYEEETVDFQTTAIPQGILTRGFGDCKHYASIIGGVIDSLNRTMGCGIEWCYMFAGYDGADEPYHVFVQVKDHNEFLWIDPTPGAGGTPSILIQKKP